MSIVYLNEIINKKLVEFIITKIIIIDRQNPMYIPKVEKLIFFFMGDIQTTTD